MFVYEALLLAISCKDTSVWLTSTPIAGQAGKHAVPYQAMTASRGLWIVGFYPGFRSCQDYVISAGTADTADGRRQTADGSHDSRLVGNYLYL